MFLDNDKYLDGSDVDEKLRKRMGNCSILPKHHVFFYSHTRRYDKRRPMIPHRTACRAREETPRDDLRGELTADLGIRVFDFSKTAYRLAEL